MGAPMTVDELRSMSETDLASLLADTDASILAVVVYHFTGDDAILDAVRPHIAGGWDYLQTIPPAVQMQVQAQAVKVLAEYFAGRRPLPAPPSPDAIRKMMSCCVGQTVGDEFFEMLRPRFGDEGRAPVDPVDVPPGFCVAIIGAGMSGILAGIKLREAGIDFRIFEKHDHVGGTWYINQYPGCGVDTPNHVYSYSFEPNHDWSRYFSLRDELHDYFEHCATKYGVRDRIRLNTEVQAARYDEATGHWTLTIRERGKAPEQFVAPVLLSCIGPLHRPYTPSIPGLDSFAGPVIHTGAWDDSVPLESRRVGMIGAGASAYQTGPTIADKVGKLVVFQRSPHWSIYNRNYHRAVEPGKKWALKNVPFYAGWYRFQLFWAGGDGLHEFLFRDPDWPHADRSLNARNQAQREVLEAHIRAELADRPDLVPKVIPPYPPYGRRMLRDNGWYQMFRRDNVVLESGTIERITPRGVQMTDGTRHDLDVLILATGFQAGKMLAHIDIRGRNGVSLADQWADDDPRAYLGITVPNFPNLLLTYGPNTNLAHGGSAIFHSECQVGYIVQAVRSLIARRARAIEPRAEVYEDYNRRVDAQHSRLVWSHPNVTSWYRNAKGRVFATTPWRMVDYWKFTRQFEAADYHWTG